VFAEFLRQLILHTPYANSLLHPRIVSRQPVQESLNNLGVMELKRDKKGEARDLFSSAQASSCTWFVAGLSMTRLLMSQEYAPHNYEPCYNIALLANKAGQFQVFSFFPLVTCFPCDYFLFFMMMVAQ
jgi:hypothetical protein